jgi:hypothetical protein
MVWGLIHGSWRHRIAAFFSELRTLIVTTKELWQLSWITLKRSGSGGSELGKVVEIGGDKGGKRLGLTI